MNFQKLHKVCESTYEICNLYADRIVMDDLYYIIEINKYTDQRCDEMAYTKTLTMYNPTNLEPMVWVGFYHK